jgi:hypothetical protein
MNWSLCRVFSDAVSSGEDIYIYIYITEWDGRSLMINSKETVVVYLKVPSQHSLG